MYCRFGPDQVTRYGAAHRDDVSDPPVHYTCPLHLTALVSLIVGQPAAVDCPPAWQPLNHLGLWLQTPSLDPHKNGPTHLGPPPPPPLRSDGVIDLSRWHAVVPVAAFVSESEIRCVSPRLNTSATSSDNPNYAVEVSVDNGVRLFKADFKAFALRPVAIPMATC